MRSDLEESRSRTPILRKMTAGLILAGAAALAILLVVHVIEAIFWVLVGVVVVERPKARYLDDGYTLELSRVCTAGRPNVASKLIAAAARAAFAMGARRVISYVLTSEAGTSYRAAGWVRVEDASGPVEFGGGEWSRPSRPRDPMQSPIDKKHRWERYNAAAIEDVRREAA